MVGAASDNWRRKLATDICTGKQIKEKQRREDEIGKKKIEEERGRYLIVEGDGHFDQIHRTTKKVKRRAL